MESDGLTIVEFAQFLRASPGTIDSLAASSPVAGSAAEQRVDCAASLRVSSD
jgi:hypothetical protein